MRPGVLFGSPVPSVAGGPYHCGRGQASEGLCRAFRPPPSFATTIAPHLEQPEQRAGGSAMIVREFDLKPCTLRKEDPAWRFALAASPVTEGHVLRLATEDGVEGFGYASATPHMGSIAGTLRAELDLFRPLVLGRDVRGVEAIIGALDRSLRGAPQAK